MTTVELIKKACAALDAAVLVDNNQYSIGRASVFLEFAEAQAKADVADHGLDMNGSTTPEEFIRLTRNAYGGKVIRKLEAYYHVD